MLKIGDVRVRCLRYCDFNRIYEKAERGFHVPLFMLLFIGNIRLLVYCDFRFAESVSRVCVSTRRQRKLRKPQTIRTANYLCHYDTALVTSTHFSYPEHFSSSGIVSSIALLELPQAGKTVSYLFSDSSR